MTSNLFPNPKLQLRLPLRDLWRRKTQLRLALNICGGGKRSYVFH